jgi:hypothetical protein
MILVCYDGSTDAQSAIDSAARLMHEVTQHADRAVLVVPSAGLAEHRRGWARHVDDAASVA